VAVLGMGDLPPDLASRLQAVVSEASKAEIVNLRNEKRGHGYCECQDEGYMDIYQAYSPIVTKIEKILLPVLMRLRCHYVLSTERIGPSGFEVRSRQLMGSHPDFLEARLSYEPKAIRNIPHANRVYVYSEIDGKWTALDPYLLFQECPLCKHTRVLISDGEQYLDPYAGHRTGLKSRPLSPATNHSRKK